VEDGLSNQQVYAIQKGPEGYLWFLTRYGIDRYDGNNFKNYTLLAGDTEINSMLHLNWLYTAHDGVLWEIGRKGHVFRYDVNYDKFQLVYQLPDSLFKATPDFVSYAFIDSHNLVWFCHHQHFYLYNGDTGKASTLPNPISEEILCMVQIDDTHYAVGTVQGVYIVEHRGDQVTVLPHPELSEIDVQTEAICLHQPSQKLFIGTLLRDMYVYDLKQQKLTQLHTELRDVSITCIRPYNDHELLIATNGAGVHKMNTETYHSEPYIVADNDSYNGMNGNNIHDVFVDGERIWMSNYPVGITVRNNLYAAYKWIKHSIGNPQSLVNNQVNYILEDHDGDQWFATNNGVSLYQPKTNRWHSFMNTTGTNDSDQNHIFLTLCEIKPGTIWAAGYTSTIYEINKRTHAITALTPATYQANHLRPDKYIRSLVLDSEGKVWSGGYYNLKVLDFHAEKVRLIPGMNGITDIIERDAASMWIGTATGLYLLDKRSGTFRNIPLPTESSYVTTLCTTPEGLLYIGTNNSGMVIYNPQTNEMQHFHKDNCGLLSNSINTILYNGGHSFLISTDRGLTNYSPQTRTFRNWTRSQGLKTDHFNPQSGTMLKRGNVVFGSTDGAVEFPHDMSLPGTHATKMLFSEFRLFYQTVYPNEENSPLTKPIDATETLHLKYNQNIFSIDVNTLSFDNPALPLYTWKMEGFYDQWSQPDANHRIRLTALNPGNYRFCIRAVSSENKDVVLAERCMDVIISQPFWRTMWAWLFYIAAAVGVAFAIHRYINMKRERKVSDDKIRFFVNTAHDIRTPLTLIKAPLEEISEKEPLTDTGAGNVDIALRNVNSLLRLTTNLINFERADTYSNTLYANEYELSAYINDTVDAFHSLAETKHISLTYRNEAGYLNVWFDKDKMDSILKNILSNAMKYTPDNGSVDIVLEASSNHWSIEVKDTGIGIPASDQKQLFRNHFRGSNAINSKVTGSGIGLLLVWKLVRLHNGKIIFNSEEKKGTYIKIVFPKTFKGQPGRSPRKQPQPESNTTYSAAGVPVEIYANPETQPTGAAKPPIAANGQQPHILIVEDNDELRTYLLNTLSEHYAVQVCGNGKEGLECARKEMPDLIISDVMMPEMNGDEMCRILKSNMETSHIPVILLTALNNDRNIIEGLNTGADEYIVKPFNIGILRATIANILNNRARLRHRYSNLHDTDKAAENEEEESTGSSELDRKFIDSIKKSVEENMTDPSFNVDTLCTLLYMSRTSFYNKLKALTGQAPADFVRLIRLKRAAQMLKEQRYSVTEIAETTGFNDAKYFREVFKKHFNMSPSQYAKNASM
jgi:signal transduction histidine kinase/DNA-binding response OmpR family regulator/ligand-binding sensor domain-containing protein